INFSSDGIAVAPPLYRTNYLYSHYKHTAGVVKGRYIVETRTMETARRRAIETARTLQSELIFIEALARFTAQMASGDHLAQQRAGQEAVAEQMRIRLQNVQQHINADEIGQLQRP